MDKEHTNEHENKTDKQTNKGQSTETLIELGKLKKRTTGFIRLISYN